MRSREVDVLLVAESVDDVQRVQQALYAQGIQITAAVARNGRLGLAYLEHHKPKAILLDLDLSDMDAIEFLRVVRKQPLTANIPVIVLTAAPHDIKRAAARLLGISGYISMTADEKTLDRIGRERAGSGKRFWDWWETNTWDLGRRWRPSI